MIEKPKPLPGPNFGPKDALRKMLEATDSRDHGRPSPLDEIDPMSLDELIARIDSGALALNQVPDPKDVKQLVQYYWSLREKFVIEQQLGIKSKPTRRKADSGPKKSIAELLNELPDDDEDEA